MSDSRIGRTSAWLSGLPQPVHGLARRSKQRGEPKHGRTWYVQHQHERQRQRQEHPSNVKWEDGQDLLTRIGNRFTVYMWRSSTSREARGKRGWCAHHPVNVNVDIEGIIQWEATAVGRTSDTKHPFSSALTSRAVQGEPAKVGYLTSTESKPRSSKSIDAISLNARDSREPQREVFAVCCSSVGQLHATPEVVLFLCASDTDAPPGVGVPGTW